MLDNDFPKHLQEVGEFHESLKQETDRGCALMIASFLDSKLEALLRSGFVDSTKIAGEILGISGPLGTFSARIDMSYLLGIVGPKIHRDLHLMRKIRNIFGHDYKLVSFNDQRISSRCKELYHHTLEEKESPRKIFIRTAMQILAIFNKELLHRSHLKEGKDLYADEVSKQKDIEGRKSIRNSILQMSEQEQEQLKRFFLQMIQQDKDA